MKKDMINTVLLICVLVICLAIAVFVATQTDDGDDVDGEQGPHSHDVYVEKAGDTMTGDLVVQNLHADEVIFGDGSGLWNLNASRMNSGTVSKSRLPPNIDAATLDGYDSFYFARKEHYHNSTYYTKTESDGRYALLGHSHVVTDADTIDGMDSTDFAAASHNHDTSYYQRSEVDSNFLGLSGGILSGDLLLPNLYVSGTLNGDGSGLWNLNASRINIGTINSARLPANLDADTLDSFDSLDFTFASDFTNHVALVDDHHLRYADSEAVAACSGIYAPLYHDHDAANITSGELIEDRLPQYSIDDTEIQPGFGLVPSGTIVMWNGTTIPAGWALCDGTNGTPDLRGMFIVGYDISDPDYDVIGNTGGEKSHTLTTGELPSHLHSFSGTTNLNGNHQHNYEDRYSVNDVLAGVAGLARDDTDVYQTKTTQSAGDHTHTISGTTDGLGGGQAHENRPPYYVMAFIMKL